MIHQINDLLNEQLDWIKDFHYIQDERELGMDVNRMWQAFYQQHKQQHGSFRFYSGKEYQDKMQERQDYIICQINTTIESRLHFRELYGEAVSYAKEMGCF